MDREEWVYLCAALLGATLGAALGLGLLLYFGGLTYVR
jgi:hypothetical protein